MAEQEVLLALIAQKVLCQRGVLVLEAQLRQLVQGLEELGALVLVRVLVLVLVEEEQAAEEVLAAEVGVKDA